VRSCCRFGFWSVARQAAEVRTNPAEAYLSGVRNLADQGVDVKLADSTRLLELRDCPSTVAQALQNVDLIVNTGEVVTLIAAVWKYYPRYFQACQHPQRTNSL